MPVTLLLEGEGEAGRSQMHTGPTSLTETASSGFSERPCLKRMWWGMRGEGTPEVDPASTCVHTGECAGVPAHTHIVKEGRKEGMKGWFTQSLMHSRYMVSAVPVLSSRVS